MSLAPGTRLGVYHIDALVGAGGMGEVYRATDPRLRREVAIKILPPAFVQDADRLRRFEQEALAAAALNHPNIVIVYDVGQVDNTPYVVSELLTGRTLREVLDATGLLPSRQAISYAVQIARGLAAAHARGIVHRDLKPENLFVMSDDQIKILDFGLAKLIEPESSVVGSTLATAAPGTQPGLILGTIGYMSPEQVRAATVDHRSDFFSLGAILLEMLTGQRAFHRETQADTLTAILKEDPLEPPAGRAVPVALSRITARCLQKLPERRFQSASDLVFALEGVAVESVVSVPTSQELTSSARRWRWTTRDLVIGGAAVLLAAATATMALRAPAPGSVPQPLGPIRFTIPADDVVFGSGGGAGVLPSIKVSPDGKGVAFVGQRSDGASAAAVWYRPFDSLVPRRLQGTDGAVGRVFWSPDSRHIGFFTTGGVRRVDLGSQVVKNIANVEDFATTNTDGTWGNGDIVLFAVRLGPIFQVSASGGSPVAVTSLDTARRDVAHRFPVFLPDGRTFLYTVQSPDPERAGVYVASLDGPATKRILDVASPTAFDGQRLLFLRDRALMAQLFVPAELSLIGQAASMGNVLRRNSTDPSGGNALSVSRTGVLVYSEPFAGGDSQLIWVDRAGRELSKAGPTGAIGNFDLSLDDKHVVYTQTQESGSANVWTFDLERNVATRVTATPLPDSSPVWAPDTKQVAFSRLLPAGPAIFVVSATGGTERLLHEPDGRGAQVDDWSPDGRVVTFNSDPSLKAIPVSGGAAYSFVDTRGQAADESHFSPDGHWIAYNSSESGTWQVYVAPFPTTGERWQVSSAPGIEGRWRADGKELYFLSLTGEMMAVAVSGGARFQASAPRPLFSANVLINARADHYGVSGDGQRFLIKRQVERFNGDPWTVVVNWPALLSRAY